jgi:hypothetical protein
MFLPSWAYFRSRNELGPIMFTDTVPQIRVLTPAGTENATQYNGSKTQTQAQPTDASLQILAVGFAAALIVYWVIRRKINRQTSMEMYRFPRA